MHKYFCCFHYNLLEALQRFDSLAWFTKTTVNFNPLTHTLIQPYIISTYFLFPELVYFYTTQCLCLYICFYLALFLPKTFPKSFASLISPHAWRPRFASVSNAHIHSWSRVPYVQTSLYISPSLHSSTCCANLCLHICLACLTQLQTLEQYIFSPWFISTLHSTWHEAGTQTTMKQYSTFPDTYWKNQHIKQPWQLIANG